MHKMSNLYNSLINSGKIKSLFMVGNLTNKLRRIRRKEIMRKIQSN